MKKAKFDVFGMTCSACSAHVQKAVEKQEGIKVQVNLLTNSMTAEYNEDSITPELIIRLVQNAGYEASLNSFLDKSGKKIQSIQTKNILKENSASVQKDDFKETACLVAFIYASPFLYFDGTHDWLTCTVFYTRYSKRSRVCSYTTFTYNSCFDYKQKIFYRRI